MLVLLKKLKTMNNMGSLTTAFSAACSSIVCVCNACISRSIATTTFFAPGINQIQHWDLRPNPLGSADRSD